MSSPAKAGDPVHVADAVLCLHLSKQAWWYALHWRDNDLARRVYEHKTKAADGFTKKYGVDRLVYFEPFGDIELAIQREKQLKKWNRAWKVRLIEEVNPNWDDQYSRIATP